MAELIEDKQVSLGSTLVVETEAATEHEVIINKQDPQSNPSASPPDQSKKSSPLPDPDFASAPISVISPSENHTMSIDKKRKRTTRSDIFHSDDFEPPYSAATDEEKRQWTGFCEIESDPAVFNLMLKDFGVRGVKIRDVWEGLPFLSILPPPVYGVIVLFHYHSDEVVEPDGICPDHLWFANQVSSASCATIALLNMVCNIDSIDIGEELKKFKTETQTLTSAQRGLEVSRFGFVREIHNTFAKKIEMLNEDALEAEQYEKGKRKRKPPTKENHAKKTTKRDDVDDSPFHFVAYMPIRQEIWSLDGLNANPRNIGPCGSDNWLDLVSGVLQAHFEGATEYTLLALVRDPYLTALDAVSYNIKFNLAIETRLADITPDWRAFAENLSEDYIASVNEAYGITNEMLQSTQISDSDKVRLQKFDEADALLRLRQKNNTEQGALRATVIAEKNQAETDEIKAKDGRHDYGPLVQRWFMMLAENGQLRSLHEGLKSRS